MASITGAAPVGAGRRSPQVTLLTVLTVLTVLTAASCGRGGLHQPVPPSLDGQRVMVLPVPAGAPAELDAELHFWLGQRAPDIDWVPAHELQRALDRAPAFRVPLDSLPREIVDAGRRAPYLVDPAYGALRRLGAIVDALVAVMPVAVRQVGDEPGSALELDAALVGVRGGRVIWITTVTGRSADGSAAGAVAAVAEALARAVVPDEHDV